jgi:hypothetical protein
MNIKTRPKIIGPKSGSNHIFLGMEPPGGFAVTAHDANSKLKGHQTVEDNAPNQIHAAGEIHKTNDIHRKSQNRPHDARR